jgi:hypothetical protein
MHPLSTFPTLLSYGLMGPTLLRIFVGLFLIYLGRQRWFRACKWTSLLYLIVGILVGMGLYTQIASLLGIVVLTFDFLMRKKSTKPEDKLTIETYLLYKICAIILLTLIFTGPGFFAFDLPL